jgi:hypothetical protein
MSSPDPGAKPKPQFQDKSRAKPRPEVQPGPPAPSKSASNPRAALAGLIIAAVILGVGLWLARDLTAASKMQDCLMSGRTNCNVIEPAR